MVYHFHAFRNTAIKVLAYNTIQVALLYVRRNPIIYNMEQGYISSGIGLQTTWNNITHDMEQHK